MERTAYTRGYNVPVLSGWMDGLLALDGFWQVLLTSRPIELPLSALLRT